MRQLEDGAGPAESQHIAAQRESTLGGEQEDGERGRPPVMVCRRLGRGGGQPGRRRSAVDVVVVGCSRLSSAKPPEALLRLLSSGRSLVGVVDPPSTVDLNLKRSDLCTWPCKRAPLVLDCRCSGC